MGSILRPLPPRTNSLAGKCLCADARGYLDEAQARAAGCSHRVPEVPGCTVAELGVAGPADQARVDLLLRVDAAAGQLHKRERVGAEFHGRTVDVTDYLGPAVHRHVQIALQR